MIISEKYTPISKFFFFLILFLHSFNVLRSQGQTDFLRQWTGQEDLESEAINYQNRNISIEIFEGGVREGFYLFESSCNFLYNDNLDWAFHYFKFDKDNNIMTFLRRFITPVGILGYEELSYNLLDWSDNYFVAQYTSQNRETYHQIRMNGSFLELLELNPLEINLGQNFPNPFNPSTSIKVYVDKLAYGEIKIFDLKGNIINSLHNDILYPGDNIVKWSGLNSQGQLIASGTYFYNLYIDGYLKGSQRMIFIK
ncbi:MAG: hypothetical protein CMG63_01465 [Candidatus Marinimicrobia bacterium]|nr:hypothetical protein [Candidatus Neomarinimicrobiota bacterium]